MNNLGFSAMKANLYPGSRSSQGRRSVQQLSGDQDERSCVQAVGQLFDVVRLVVQHVSHRVVLGCPGVDQHRAGVVDVDHQLAAAHVRELRAVFQGGALCQPSPSCHRHDDEDGDGDDQHRDGRSGRRDAGDAGGCLEGVRCSDGRGVDDGRLGRVGCLDDVVGDAERRREQCSSGDDAEAESYESASVSALVVGWAHWVFPFVGGAYAPVFFFLRSPKFQICRRGRSGTPLTMPKLLELRLVSH